jgi:hypothetical protein
MRILGVSVLGLLELAGCARGPGAARHTIDEYREDPVLRQAAVKRCRQDPGTLRETPDCINAETAAVLEDRLPLREAPTVGLEAQSGSSDRTRE